MMQPIMIASPEQSDHPHNWPSLKTANPRDLSTSQTYPGVDFSVRFVPRSACSLANASFLRSHTVLRDLMF